jgi:MFS family permease
MTSGVVHVERLAGNVARGLGLLGGTASAGMVAGSLLCRVAGPRIGERRLLCAALALTGASVMAFGAASGYAVLFAVFFAGGAFLAPVVISSETLQQRLCPPALMGRVFALRDFANRLGFLLAAVPGGLLASRWPLRLVLGAAGATLVIAAGVLACAWRDDGEEAAGPGRR